MNLATIAKVIERQSPELFKAAVKMCEPCLSDKALIPQIYKRMREVYPDQDRTDDSIVFSIAVYQAYAPATLIETGIARAPIGVREEMCNVMQWKDGPICNYYQDLGRVYQKVPTYKAKVENILAGFVKPVGEEG